MKKSLMVFCGAALALAAFAEPEAAAPGCACNGNPSAACTCKGPEGCNCAKPARPDRPPRPNVERQRPPTLVLDGKTTPEQVEAFKKEICEKVDAAFAAQAAKAGEERQPTRIVLFVNDRGFGPGMGPQGRGGRRGPDGMGPRGKGPRQKRPSADGAPMPPPAPTAE